MIEPGTFKGARGFIKHAYRQAAEVTGFVITFDRKTHRGTLVGAAAWTDPYLLTQRPLLFVVPSRLGLWRWPVETITLIDTAADARVKASLGPLLNEE